MHDCIVSMVTSAAVRRYKASIRDREDSHFVLPLRKELWQSFGPVERADGTRAERTPAHTKRVRLAITTCQKVLPVWERQIPQSDIAQRALQLAEQSLTGETDDKTVREAVNRFVTGVENTAGTTTAELNAQLVGWACCKMLSLALSDCYVGEKTVHDAALDDWDYSLYAAGAHAGGFPFNERAFQSDPDRLQEFWFWYVEQAHRIAE
ncbi:MULTISPECIES: Imm5 family immunity protein [unclassified Natrinema]|uniref:Imm5 family immunity protein n=1 Tax=unclassified Natrinema TaxID=2622230 RepID=UPI0011AE51B3